MRHLLHRACILGVALALLATALTAARAQEAQPTEQFAPAAEPSPDRPGLFNELGKLFKSPADLFPALSKPDTPPPAVVPAPAPAVPQAAQPLPNPTIAAPVMPPIVEPPPAASTRLFPGMASGREACPRSANGAPDCQAGADKLCQSKGYKGGKSLNTDSAFGCSTRQARADGGGKACGTEHFVTSAFCN